MTEGSSRYDGERSLSRARGLTLRERIAVERVGVEAAAGYNSLMKIKLFWTVAAMCLVPIAWVVVTRVTFCYSARTPSFSERARESQATPRTTVEATFQMMYPTPDVVDRFNEVHLLEGKDMTPEEQAFAELFWDTRRSGILCEFMTEAMTESPSVIGQEVNGDSATVKVSVTVSPPHSDKSSSMVFTFDLKKRGPNWYVYELRVPKAPEGVFNRVKANS
jgi:hypothetical protein